MTFLSASVVGRGLRTGAGKFVPATTKQRAQNIKVDNHKLSACNKTVTTHIAWWMAKLRKKCHETKLPEIGGAGDYFYGTIT